jgi:hypothetical protein
MTADEEHLRLLSIFHYVVAGLGALLSLIPVMHILMGVGMLTGGFDGPATPMEGRIFGWFFIAMGSAFFLGGLTFSVCLAIAGRSLARREHYTFCLVMAAVACALFPFGTILGVFTILVLQKQPVRELFGRN